MKGLKPLILMQLKDKIDLSFTKSVKKTIFKVVLSILKFAIITALIYFAFYFVSALKLVSFNKGLPQEFFVIILAVMFILSVIVCTFGLMKNLYFTKDNPLLLTLPASRITVFSSKLIVYYIYELIRSLTYLLPLLIAYGLINGLPPYFYAWLPLPFLLITALPVILGALFSIPTMFVSQFIKRFKLLQFTLIAGLIAVGAYAIVVAINAIPVNFDLIGTWGTTFWEVQAFMKRASVVLKPLVWVMVAVVGLRYSISNILFSPVQFLYLGGIILTIIVVGAITFLLVQPLFFKMASTPFEFSKIGPKKVFKNKKHTLSNTFLLKDAKMHLRTPEKIYTLLFSALGLPISIFLLNKIYMAMDTRLTGGYMVVAFNVLLMLLIVLASNAALARIYSEEGASGYLLKTHPQPYLKILFSKLVINLVVMSISLLAAVIIFSRFVEYDWVNILLMFGTLEAFYLAHLLWSAELDVMNPQTAHYKTTGSHLYNPNEIKSTLFAFLISAFVAFFIFFIISENPLIIWRKMLFVSLAFLALRAWFYVNKIKVYFKEKE